MAVELTEELQAADVLKRFLSQDRYRIPVIKMLLALCMILLLLFLCHLLVSLALSLLTMKQEDLCLYESGGNISKYVYAFVISA